MLVRNVPIDHVLDAKRCWSKHRLWGHKNVRKQLFVDYMSLVNATCSFSGAKSCVASRSNQRLSLSLTGAWTKGIDMHKHGLVRFLLMMKLVLWKWFSCNWQQLF